MAVSLGLCGALLGAAALWTERLKIAPPAQSPLVQHGWRLVDPPSPRRPSLGLPRWDPSLGPSPVVINEVMTANQETVLDEDLAPSDWLELYNRSEAPIDLNGWALAQGRRSRHRWVLPDVVLPAKRSLVVWASGKDRVGSAASRFIAITLDPGATGSRRFEGPHRPEQPLWYRDQRAPRFRVAEVVLDLPTAGRYALWLRARDLTAGLSRLRVTVDGKRTDYFGVPAGGQYGHVRIPPRGENGGVWSLASGQHVIRIRMMAGVAQVERVTLTASTGIVDPYGLHLHTSFRLRRTGEAVTLLDRAGVVRDQVTPRAFESRLSLQRVPAGGPWAGLRPPTPEGRTTFPAPDLSALPSVSAQPFRVAPSLPPGVDELRYTVDGAVPGPHSPRLAGPLEIRGPTVLRVRGYTAGEPSTPIATRQFWVGPLPGVPVVMVALDPALLHDDERGMLRNSRWRMRPRDLPGPPVLRALQRARDREWASWRRAVVKSAHVLLVDRSGVLLDDHVRVRPQGGPEPAEGFQIGGPLPRDPFEPPQAHAPRRVLVDFSGRLAFANQWGYELIRASGGVAPRAGPGLLFVNGRTPADAGIPRTPLVSLVENIDRSFLAAHWKHDVFDLIKGRPLRVLRGSVVAFQELADRIERGGWDAAAIEQAVDLTELTALHFALVFMDVSGFGDPEGFQGYMAIDRTAIPPRLRAIGWDVDQSFRRVSWDTFASQTTALRGQPARSRFLPALIVIHLLDHDPAFRDRYLRHAEWAMNHVFTAERWGSRWPEADFDPTFVGARARIREFLEARPSHVRMALRSAFSLPAPRSARVEIAGAGRVIIDGQEYRGTFEGRYFAGGTLKIVVPEELRGTFRHWVVGEDVVTTPFLRLPVTDDLRVTAVFDP